MCSFLPKNYKKPPKNDNYDLKRYVFAIMKEKKERLVDNMEKRLQYMKIAICEKDEKEIIRIENFL